MRSSIVSTIQECYCGWVSLELLLTWFQKYNLLFPTTLARLFHPLIVSVNGTTMSYPKLFRVSALKLFFFCLPFFYCLTYTTYNTILTLPTLLTLIKTLTSITILTLRYITVLNTTLAKTYLQNIFIFV